MFRKSAPSSANRRRKSSSPKRDRKRSSQGKSKPSQRNLDEETQTLHARIGALEEFIAGSPFRDRRDRFQTRDTVPPPDRMRGGAARNKSRRHQPNRRELEAMRKERASHLFTFVSLFAAVCAMLYWLLQIID